MPRRTQGEKKKKKKTERALRRHPPLQLRPLLLSPTMLLTGMESAATHVSDQVQPASSVSKLQAPGKPTESTFIAGDPVTECVIHYSLICSPDPSPPQRCLALLRTVLGATRQPDRICRSAHLCLLPLFVYQLRQAGRRWSLMVSASCSEEPRRYWLCALTSVHATLARYQCDSAADFPETRTTAGCAEGRAVKCRGDALMKWPQAGWQTPGGAGFGCQAEETFHELRCGL